MPGIVLSANETTQGRNSCSACLPLLLLLLLGLGFSWGVGAAEELGRGRPALPGEPCQTAPHILWTRQEQWVWVQICTGKVADFNTARGYGGRLDPSNPEKWPEARILRPVFLETILLHEPFRSALPRQGISIRGAWFTETLDLSYAILPHQLRLEDSRFDAPVSLAFLRTLYPLSFAGSVFTQTLDMRGVQVQSSLFLDDGVFADVILSGARIDGNLELDGASFPEVLTMNDLQVGRSLFMRKARFADINLINTTIQGQLILFMSTVTGQLNLDRTQVEGSIFLQNSRATELGLRGARIGGDLQLVGSTFADRAETRSSRVDLTDSTIGGHLSLRGSTFTDLLQMNNLRVGGSLFLGRGARFAAVDLTGTHVRGELVLDYSTFTGPLTMELVRVERHLLLRGARVVGRKVRLPFAEIGGNLDLSGATLPSFDLTGARIQRVFRLGSAYQPPPRWEEEAVLVLYNTLVDSIEDRPDAWPNRLELNGFTYTRFDGWIGSGKEPDRREIAWFIGWLEKQKPYSSQPYTQLARVFRQTGHTDMAAAILYAGKRRAHRETTRPFSWRWWWLTLQQVFIGYGYRIHYALYWIGGSILLGSLLLRLSGQDRVHGMRYCGLAYSCDMLLPLIDLHRPHTDICLEGWVRVYFYLHKLFGYVLAFFLVAGLAGWIR
ncbi:MAG: hypothetical protein D6736_00740 [Nitrospinota bacterium]|nr:MAG: hypothetical protein D6736_00740 [Nitrospinota bacterium]